MALRAAAERAIRLGSPAQAVLFLDQALEVTRDEAESAQLLERVGRAAQDAGLTEVAEDRARRAIDLRRSLGDADAIAGATAMLGEFLTTGLRPEAALAILQPAIEELIGPAASTGQGEPTIGPGGVALLAQLARAYFFNESYGRAIEVIDRALAEGERLDLVGVVSDALITRGGALSHVGRMYEGSGAMQAGVELAERHGLVRTALRGRLNLAVFQGGSDPRAGLANSREALDLARRLGLESFVRTLVGNAAGAAADVGEWDWAVQEITAAHDEGPDEFARNYASWQLIYFHAWRGEDVTTEVARLAAWAEGFDETGAREAVHDLRAVAAFGIGEWSVAADEWLAYAPSDALNAPGAYVFAGLAALLAGDGTTAATALAALVRTARRGPMPSLDRRLLDAGIAILDGREAEGRRDALAVIAGYADLGLPWRQALGSLMLAERLGADDPETRAAAEMARAIFERLGARPFLERLEAALAGKARAVSGGGVRVEPGSPIATERTVPRG